MSETAKTLISAPTSKEPLEITFKDDGSEQIPVVVEVIGANKCSPPATDRHYLSSDPEPDPGEVVCPATKPGEETVCPF